MERVWPAQNLWESARAEDLKLELQFQLLERWKNQEMLSFVNRDKTPRQIFHSELLEIGFVD